MPLADGRPDAGVSRGRLPAWTRFACRLCDGAIPGSGMLLSGRIGAGALALAAWGLAWIALSASVCLAEVHPLRAIVVAGIVHLALLVLLGLEPLGDRPRPGEALFGLAALALVVGSVLGYGLGRVCVPVLVRDRCEFPGLLPGEVVLVHRTSSDPLRPGDLVAVRTPRGPAIARVIGQAGDRVVFQGASVTINDAVVPSTEKGAVILPEDLDAPPEETRDLYLYEEELVSGRHPFFFRRGVVVAETIRETPEGHLVLACDNRSTADALDSREIGAISADAVLGRPGPVLWSFDPVRGVRLDRLGAVWR